MCTSKNQISIKKKKKLSFVPFQFLRSKFSIHSRADEIQWITNVGKKKQKKLKRKQQLEKQRRPWQLAHTMPPQSCPAPAPAPVLRRPQMRRGPRRGRWQKRESFFFPPWCVMSVLFSLSQINALWECDLHKEWFIGEIEMRRTWIWQLVFVSLRCPVMISDVLLNYVSVITACSCCLVSWVCDESILPWFIQIGFESSCLWCLDG